MAGFNETRKHRDDRASLRSKENCLFDDWQGDGLQQLVRDGAMDGYANADRRLLFVLKEPNDPSRRWEGDLRQAPTWYGKKNFHSATWEAIACWTAMILKRKQLKRPIREADWRYYLSQVAVVNLKKTGGSGRADHGAIKAYLGDGRNSEMLRRQLALYAPQVTICGGDFVADCLIKLYADKATWQPERWSHSKRGSQGDEIWELDTPELGHMISFWHPAQWARKHDDLVGMLQEIGKGIRQELASYPHASLEKRSD